MVKIVENGKKGGAYKNLKKRLKRVKKRGWSVLYNIYNICKRGVYTMLNITIRNVVRKKGGAKNNVKKSKKKKLQKRESITVCLF